MNYTGEMVILRPMTVEDTDDIVRWRNTDYVRENFIYRGEFTREGHLNWIKTMVDTGKVVQYIIVEKSSGASVGSVFLRDIDQSMKTAEYGIFIGEKKALNQGYGSESAQLMVEMARKELKLNKLFLRLYEENIGARISYERAGFKLVESKRDIKNDKPVIFMELNL